MVPVSGAVVTTNPATETLTTDALGTVLFRSVGTGFYLVTAANAAHEASEAAVTVKDGQLAQVSLVLRPVTGDAALPGVGGAGGGGAGPGQGGAGGGGPPLSDASVDGVSPTDGQQQPPTPDGGTSTLVLSPLTKDSNGVDLSWTSEVTYPTYRVYRAQGGPFSIIGILNAPPALTYRDSTVSLGVTYQYKIGGVTAGGAEVSSNTQSITAGMFIAVNSEVEKMKVDPQRPYLYAIDRVNNSLHFVDLTANTVSSTIFVGSSPTDLDINIEGTELFIANFGGTEIAVVDLDTQLKTRSLFVDTSLSIWSGNPYRLACMAGDTLVFTSQDQWNDLKLVRASDGNNITVAGTLYEPYLSASPDGSRVYATGDDLNGLARYDLGSSMLTQSDGSGNGIAEGVTVLATRDGSYVFSANQKFLANNLKSVLGSFGDAILAANRDGSIAISATNIYDGTTFATKNPLPLSTTVMAISADDKTLYLYDTKTSRIYIYNL